MKIVASRSYGEPKLIKPKELNNNTLIGSVKWNEKCSCKVWKCENEIYILHRDWFSRAIGIPTAVAKGILPVLPKNKFIYNDNFGSVVLRNECIFKLDCVLA